MPLIPHLVLATHNPGKVKEISALLAGRVARFSSADSFDLPEPEETGASFAENALLKARAAAEKTGLPALADDSGLCVSALDGAPGIHSARWAGPDKDFAGAMARIHDELGANPDRRAAFVCVLALVRPDGTAATFEGRVEGAIIWPPRGAGGFGYDPFFVPEEGDGRSFAEMTPAEKRALSHRARAFAKLADAL